MPGIALIHRNAITEMENPYASPSHVDYDPGRVSAAEFLAAICLTLVCASLLAVLLAVLFNIGFYFVVWVPVVAGLVLSGLLFWTIQAGHCRNRLLAALIAIVATLTMYVGQYHVDMIWRAGPGTALRFDLLPRYIAWRKSVEIDDRPRHLGNADKKPNVAFNWFWSAFELGSVSVFTIGAAVSAAGRPYCGHCQKWMRRDADYLPAGAAPALLQALQHDSLGDLLDLPSNDPHANRRYTAVTASWCPAEGGGRSQCPAYLTVKSVAFGGGMGQLNSIDLAFGRTRLYMRPLTERQIAELRPRFPEMSKAARGIDATT